MVQAIMMPMEAATEAKRREFFKQLIVSVRPKTVCQLERVKLPGRSMLLPTSTLKEVAKMVAKGMRITTTAKRETRTVKGTRQKRRSTTAGLTDLPETVMYCFFASTTSERKRISTATVSRKTAMPVASFMPCWPRPTYSTILVVTVWTRPGEPMIEGMP